VSQRTELRAEYVASIRAWVIESRLSHLRQDLAHDLEADVLTLAVAVEPQNQQIATLPL